MKKITTLSLLWLWCLVLCAQNATNSPYSQYGYGTLADRSNGASVGMCGLSQGWREGNTVNFANPASYSCIDSQSFIFDAGITGLMTNFTEGNRKVNAYNSSFDYIVGAFRVFPRTGLAIGVIPYSNVGYSYNSGETIGADVTMGDTKTTAVDSYSGSGGIHQGFIGIGAAVVKTAKTNLSIGVNASYLWGNYDKAVINSYSDVYINTLSKYYLASFNSYKIDASLQFQQQLGTSDWLTIGATYTFGHNMKANPECLIISNNSQTGVSDTTRLSAGKYLAMPTTICAGFIWNHDNKFRVGADWTMERWSEVWYPEQETIDDIAYYNYKEGEFSDRQRITIGGEYCYNELSRRWVHRLRYRLGATYATPYLKINGKDGPREYGVSAGIGIPIINGYNNRSILNVSFAWTRNEATGLIKENIFRISLGLTFNERWFAKWQVE